MKLVSNKNDPIDLNDVPLSTLIELNSDAIDGNFNPRPFPGNSSNNFGNPYGNPSYNNRNNSDLDNNIKG